MLATDHSNQWGTNNNRLPDRCRHGQFGWMAGLEVIDDIISMIYIDVMFS